MSSHEPRLSGTKTCRKCEKELPVIHFEVCKRNKDGLSARCRECERKRNRKRSGGMPGRQGMSKEKIEQLRFWLGD